MPSPCIKLFVREADANAVMDKAADARQASRLLGDLSRLRAALMLALAGLQGGQDVLLDGVNGVEHRQDLLLVYTSGDLDGAAAVNDDGSVVTHPRLFA